MPGDYHLAQGDFTGAIDAWKSVEDIRPRLLPVVVPRIIDAYGRFENSGNEIHSYLEGLRDKYDSEMINSAWLQMVEKREGENRARESLIEYCERSPSRYGIRRLIHDWVEGLSDIDTPRMRIVFRRFLDSIDKDETRFLCSQCGFSGRTLHWQCPGCDEWDTCAPPASEMDSGILRSESKSEMAAVEGVR